MMRRCATLLFALLGCSDDYACPLVAYIDGFQLVLDSATWTDARYSVEVSYTERNEPLAFRCDADLPTYEATDGGLVMSADAGVTARGNFDCVALNPTVHRASGSLGQAMVLRFEGTPATAHVVVREDGAIVKELDQPIRYQTSHPEGPHCSGVESGAARIEL
jgi:hypothetical protein